MKSLSSWLLVMFMGMFWVFRIVVAFQAQYGQDFGGFIAFNLTIEVILLFLTIVCMALVLRRNIIGGIIYLGAYGYYFGGYILTNSLPSLINGETLSIATLQNTMVSAVGLIIALLVFFDLLIARVRRRDPKDKKTDWYFQNDKYDRKYDESADKNEYRNY